MQELLEAQPRMRRVCVEVLLGAAENAGSREEDFPYKA
jgi:hypothetical protein